MRPAILLLLAGLAVPVAAQPGEITLGGAPAPAQVVDWEARAVPVARRPGTYRVELTGQIARGWRVYGMAPSTTGRPLVVQFGRLPAGFTLAGAPREAAPTLTGRDEVLDIEYPYFAGRAAVVAELRAGRAARPGRHVVRGTVRYAACDDRVCLPARTVPFEATVVVAARR